MAGLVGRAKNIVQLRPRNPESPMRSSIPVKAICDYRQIEVHSWSLHFMIIIILRISKPCSESELCSKSLAQFFQITIHKDDECVLANNSHRAKWKVINPAGNEAMVPSVCFTVPPPNKEAVDMATR